ncbi:hypothetical protein QL285_051644 [Trifolium repens]|nr:hypothetical protein QL285_051644 [Trifolium repens]
MAYPTLAFTNLINDMLRICDIDASTLHLVYEMWDSMIQNVRAVIYRHEGIETIETSNVCPFYDVVHSVLNSGWSKNCTPLHCLTHSLNPRYYSDVWLREAPNRVPPHQNAEISNERNNVSKDIFHLLMRGIRFIKKSPKFHLVVVILLHLTQLKVGIN